MLKSNSDLENLHFTPLSSLAEIVMGQSPDSKFVNDEQFGSPFLQGNGEFATKYPKPIHWVTHPGKMAKKGDILISVRAPVGEINISDQDYCIGRGLAAIRFKNRIDPDYGWYAISFYKGQINRFAQGSTFLAVNSNDIRSIEIPMLEESEQRKIAEILTTVDDAIEQTEALIRKYQRIKQGLMQDLLTRGVDENGLLRPSQVDVPSLYKWSEFGWIPNCWDVLSIRNVVSLITSGSRGWAQYYSEEGALFIRIGNLSHENINLRFDSIQRVNPPRNSEGKRTVLSEGDVLVSITADLGAIGVIPQNFEEAYCNQHIALLRVDSSWTNPRWLGHYLASSIGQKQFTLLNDSGAKAGLNLPTVSSIRFANPQKEERDVIVRILDHQDKMIEVENNHRYKLERLKKSLMQDLLTGKVRVNALLKN